MKVVDPSFGISDDARAVLALLALEQFSVPADSRAMTFATTPFVNGREAGFMVSVGDFLTQKSFRIVVVNHRRSDCLRVWSFMADKCADDYLSVHEVCAWYCNNEAGFQDRQFNTIQEAVHAVKVDLQAQLVALAVPTWKPSAYVGA